MKIDYEYASGENERITKILNEKKYEDLTNDDLEKIIKLCSRCNIEKSLINYSKYPKGFLGHQSACKECVREKSKENYLKIKAKTPKSTIKIL